MINDFFFTARRTSDNFLVQFEQEADTCDSLPTTTFSDRNGLGYLLTSAAPACRMQQHLQHLQAIPDPRKVCDLLYFDLAFASVCACSLFPILRFLLFLLHCLFGGYNTSTLPETTESNSLDYSADNICRSCRRLSLLPTDALDFQRK